MVRRLVGIIIIVVLLILYFDKNNDELLDEVRAMNIYSYEYFSDEYNEIIIMKNVGQLESIIRDLDVLISNKEFCSDRVIIEGYTNKINKSISINNKKINIQISICSDTIIIGSPLINGSF